ncbi:mannan endo-1,4-beta-mannosidase [Nocardiopsis flavescens]|uniref:Mannan endo-1,4-beta-mannosidase n=1 Tax=Nocardiopsis flavescens TaxID=758803 RepID=A0A1M6LYZ1_9ACTN|nr:glycosyl hydrolase [Nocardiopsis flavescens]SHJ76320.1 mannan endo-1,4-beta-mannosidase [Nocardiopsis flavescens]
MTGHPRYQGLRRNAVRVATALLVAAPLLTAAPSAAGTAAAPPGGAAPGTARVDDTLAFLEGISGTSTVSGQHNKEPNSDPARHTRRVFDITGEYPGLWGGDFLFASSDVEARQTMVDEAAHQWGNGAIVTLTWHVCPPTQGSSCSWEDGVMSSLDDGQWAELITDGSPLNRAWKARLDEAVPYLRQLESQGVEVVWRPLHEMNDPWAWWGGRPGEDGSAELFRITHDHLTGERGLTNLVSNWNVKDVDVDSIGDYWPGDEYVDIASIDIWMKNQPSAQDYAAMREVAGGRPIALGEVGQVPGVETLEAQPDWVYFMTWPEYLDDKDLNPDSHVQRTYYDGRVLVLREMP